MKNTLLPLVLAGLTSVVAAQQASVTAHTQVIVGCTLPAPVGSLVAKEATPRVLLPDANDIIVGEIESIDPAGDWVFETVRPHFQGTGYFRWNGPDLNNISGQGILSYSFNVEHAGDYAVRVWSQQNAQDASQENDCWVRVDNGGWKKLLGFQVGYWNQNAVLQATNDIVQENLSAGIHTLEFSGRSTNFKLDRFEIVPLATLWADYSRPSSATLRSRPVMGQTFTFEIGDPTDSRGLTPGALAILGMGNKVQNAPCGVTLPALGELLVNVPFVLGPLTQNWNGPAAPATFALPIPNDATLLGRTFTWQGAIIQPGRVVLTDALDVLVGDV